MLKAFYRDRLSLAYTTQMLDEYMSVMERPKFAAFIDANSRLCLALKLRASGLLVLPASVPDANWPDEDDLPFVAAAPSTKSQIVVTLNPLDFAPAAARGARVRSPSEARRELP